MLPLANQSGHELPVDLLIFLIDLILLVYLSYYYVVQDIDGQARPFQAVDEQHLKRPFFQLQIRLCDLKQYCGQ